MDFGIGETIALSAALGAGSAAMKNQDPLRGALIGGVLGGATAGIGGAFAGGASAEATLGAQELANVTPQVAEQTIGNEGINQLVGNDVADQTLGQSMNNMAQTIPTTQAGINQAAGNAADLNDLEAGQALKNAGQTVPQGTGVGANAANTYTPNAAGKGFFEQSDKTWLGDKPLSPFMKMAAPAVATTFTPALNSGTGNKYGVPPTEHYTGPLSKFKYDPNNYQPDVVNPPNPHYQANYAGYAGAGYAQGGITQLNPQTSFAVGGSAPLVGTPAANTTMDSTMGNNAMFPMSEMERSYYATPTQLPSGINAQNNPATSQSGQIPGYGPRLDTNTGQMMNNFAEGGIAGLLKGRGDGMSDDIHATINDKQPARLADGEFVVPADVVSHLGNGSTDAGAKHLYAMMDKVRQARTGRKSQGKQISAGGYLPA